MNKKESNNIIVVPLLIFLSILIYYHANDLNIMIENKEYLIPGILFILFIDLLNR
jgi:hypothetical protein